MPVQKKKINQLEKNLKNNTLAPAVELIKKERENAIRSSTETMLM